MYIDFLILLIPTPLVYTLVIYPPERFFSCYDISYTLKPSVVVQCLHATLKLSF